MTGPKIADGRPLEALLLDQQICFPLYAATNLLQRLYRPLLAPLGLTYSQYLVMLALWERSPASVSELCARLHLDNGTVTPLLKRLERNGLLTRRRDSADERRVQIDLTAQGRSLRDRARTVPGKLAGCMAMTHEEAACLHGLTTSLVRDLSVIVGSDERRLPTESGGLHD